MRLGLSLGAELAEEHPALQRHIMQAPYHHDGLQGVFIYLI